MAKKAKVLQRNAPKDFVKDKAKVGKKRKAPQNETKTDFKVKQVHMPAQTALEVKGEEVTHRGLGLQELLAHMQHHSTKVRKDAFLGLRELCSTHEGVLLGNLARIVEATTLAVIDASSEVRAAFIAFQTWLLGAVSRDMVLAFAPTLALHVRSALSHVSGEVRLDGLALLDLYVNSLGGEQIFKQAEVAHLVGILCQTTTNESAVLPCLYRLLGLSSPDGPAGAPAGTTPGLQRPNSRAEAQVSIHVVLEGRVPAGGSLGGGRAAAKASSLAAAGEVEAEDSDVWAYCLQAWLQDTELPSGALQPRPAAAAGAPRDAPGLLRLQCCAVLEQALDCAEHGGVGGVRLRPSASQVAALANTVRRGEFPARVDERGRYRAVADSINLRMGRIFARVAASGGARAAAQHKERLAHASLQYLEEVSARLAAAPGGQVLGAGRAGGAAALEPQMQKWMLKGDMHIAYVLRSLDLLWACSVAAPGDYTSILAPQQLHVLADVTARVVPGCEPSSSSTAGSAAAESAPAAALAAPLAASLLGLRPSAATARRPAALRVVWPEALAGCGEPGFEGVLEDARPGVALAWVTAWPRLLWYLGGSDPAISAFLLSLLLDLAKKAAEAGSLAQRLWAAAAPLLVPFLGGRPGAPDEEAPPLARLPADADGPQRLAAALLAHFPRLAEPLVKVVTRLVCRWSDVGTAGDDAQSADKATSPSRISAASCELLLDGLLQGRESQAEELLTLRLRVAISILTASPRRWPLPAGAPIASRAEVSALQFVRSLAQWLVQDCTSGPGGAALLGAAARLELGARRRLVVQAVAWPLCKEVMAASPSLAPRVLCFLFFCTWRLPLGTPPRWGWCAFLREVFGELVLAAAAAAFRPGASGEGGAYGVAPEAVLSIPEGQEAQKVLTGDAASTGVSAQGPLPERELLLEARRRLGCLFVASWVGLVPEREHPLAYELLVKLCAMELIVRVRATGADSCRGSAGGDVSTQSGGLEVLQSLAGCAAVLGEAIAWRNATSLHTDGWGAHTGDRHAWMPAELAAAQPAEVRAQLGAALQVASAISTDAPGLARLSALLPLL